MPTRARFRLVRDPGATSSHNRASTDGHAVILALKGNPQIDWEFIRNPLTSDDDQGRMLVDKTFSEWEIVLPAALDVPGFLSILTPLMSQHGVLPEGWTVDTV